MNAAEFWGRPGRLVRASAAVAVLVLLAAGCGGGGKQEDTTSAVGAAQGTEQGDDVGADDSGNDSGNDSGDDAEAPGAPIKVPARVQDQGLPISTVLEIMETGIREQCGGSLCVKLRVEPRDEGEFCTDAFVYSEPAQRDFAERGSTIVLVTGSKDCSGDEDSGDGEESGGEESGGGDGTDVTPSPVSSSS